MTISEVSKKYELSPDTLRFYEKEGLIPHPKKKGKNRDYDEDTIGWVEFIKCMRMAGVEISVLKEYVSLYFQGDSTLLKRKELLIKQREILRNKFENIKKSLSRLDYKIDNYEKLCLNLGKKK